MNLIIAGGTGLVGRSFVDLAHDVGHQVVAIGRRAAAQADQNILSNFHDMPALPGADCAICVLGTTIKQAGSRSAFKAIDHDAVLSFASAVKRAGTQHFLVVTAVGANPKARVFYSQVKGQVEQSLEAHKFERLDVLQPGLLLGRRTDSRPVETVLQRMAPLTDLLLRGPIERYRSIAADDVAKALLYLCQQHRPGVYRHDTPAMTAMASHWEPTGP